MSVTKVCCTCLSFDVEMLSLADDGIRECFEKVIADIRIELPHELLQNVCAECVMMMKKFVKFKDRCLQANQRLRQLLSQYTYISKDILKAESKKLYSETEMILYNASKMNLAEHEIFFEETASNIKLEDTSDFVPPTDSIHDFEDKVKHVETQQNDLVSSIKSEFMKIHDFVDEVKHVETQQNDLASSVKSEFIKIHTIKVEPFFEEDSKEVEKKPQKKRIRKKKPKQKKALWKPDFAVEVILTEDEQRMELFNKKISETFINAPFKCTDCVVTFKIEEKLQQHMHLHCESRGVLQCDICKIRYGNPTQLQLHQAEHRNRYKCLTCGEITKNKFAAISHQKRHSSDYVFKCKRCEANFKSIILYRRHTRTAHPTDFACDLCGDYFKGQRYLERHKKNGEDCKNSPKSIIKCNKCDAQFLRVKAWYTHMLRHAQQKELNPPTECQLCEHSTASWSEWSCHIIREHVKKKNVDGNNTVVRKRGMTCICDVCGKTLSSKFRMALHIQVIHANVNAVSSFMRNRFIYQDVCKICNKSVLRFNMKRHLLTHTGEKPYQCDECGKCFTQEATMKTHVLEIHKKERSEVLHLSSCLECPKKFKTEQNLLSHQLTHAGEKAFSCVVCQRKYSSKKTLDIHLKTHTDGKELTCDICQRTYSTKSSLELHRNWHTGQNRHACDICHKTFSTKPSLQNHQYVHTGETPFACIICDKRFNMKCNLKRHELTHTGEKNWTCNLCGKKFTESSSLKLHTNTVHLKLPHPPRKPKRKHE